MPTAKGTSTDAAATAVALPRIWRMADRSISKPTTNMNSTNPTLARTARNGRESTGKILFGRSPGSNPSAQGPSARPARISAMTGGWFRLRSNQRATTHVAVTTARPSRTHAVVQSALWSVVGRMHSQFIT